MAPARSYGLPWHMLYPLIAIILIAVPLFSSANSVYFVSGNTVDKQVRFGSRGYCGYNITQTEGVQHHVPLGCVSGGWSYTVDTGVLAMNLPSAITVSLSKAAAMLLVSFCTLLLSIPLQAWTTRYSLGADPNKNRLYTLVQVHFAFTMGIIFYTWISFIALVSICGAAANTASSKAKQVVIWWGSGCWLALAGAAALLPWGYEAVRWRHVENSKKPF